MRGVLVLVLFIGKKIFIEWLVSVDYKLTNTQKQQTISRNLMQCGKPLVHINANQTPFGKKSTE